MPEETVLKCYQVGDLDYVAATNENEARKVLAEMNGEDPLEYAEWDVELVDEAKLDKQWVDEDPPHAECGCLRQWLAAAKVPIYLVGTEG